MLMVVETQSYDYIDGNWVYNSEDKTPLINVENAQEGTISKVLGLNALGKLVKGDVSGGGGTQIYLHLLQWGTSKRVYLYSKSATPYTSYLDIYQDHLLSYAVQLETYTGSWGGTYSHGLISNLYHGITILSFSGEKSAEEDNLRVVAFTKVDGDEFTDTVTAL